MKVPSFKIDFTEEDIEFAANNLKEILRGNSFFSQYKFCEELERKFAEYNKSKYAATVANGTCALEIILRGIDVRGKEVIVPTNTFAATAFAVIHAGGIPVFADCREDLTVDPDDVRNKITTKTKAVMTVHIGGLVSPATYELMDICKDRNIALVEDAAHAHGSTLDRKKAGTFGIAGGFSFFSTKVMTTGEGGIITTDDENIYKKAVIIRDQAKIKKGPYQNYQEEIGNNWRMLEISAILGIRQLARLEQFIRRRNEIAKIYNEEFAKVDKLKILEVPSNVRSNFYKYVMFLGGANREELAKTLKDKYNISMGGYVYEIPLHLLPAFKEYARKSMPVSEKLCANHICPPIYSNMTDEEAMYVAKSIRECLK
jgi:dTDP-4-amino-4,6-dideoxygalactose transaminase